MDCSSSPIDGYRASIEGNSEENSFIPVLRDRKSKKTWDTNKQSTTEILLEYFRAVTGCSAIGFFCCSYKDAYYIPGLRNDYKQMEQFKQDKSIALGEVGGYSEFFALDTTQRKFKGVDDLNENASATVLRNAFIKEAQAGKTSQKILNQFAEAVAQD